MSSRPKRTAKTPSRFDPQGAALEKTEKTDKKKKVGVRKIKGANKKAPKVKDPNAPKRARTPYIIFATEERPKAKAANPDLGFGALTKVVSDKWKSLSDDEKAPYVEKAAKDKERYAEELKKYQGSGNKSDSDAKSAEEEDDEDEGDE